MPLGGPPGGVVVALREDSSEVWYVGMRADTGNAVYTSTDRGERWIPSLRAFEAAFPLAVLDNGVVYARIDGVSRSTDHGSTWQPLVPPSATGFGRNFAVGPGEVLYASADSSLYVSLDTGKSWRKCSDDIYNYVLSIAVDSSGSVLAAFYNGATQESYLLRSTNNGVEWTDTGHGGPDRMVVTGNGMVYAQSWDGDVFAPDIRSLYRSTDGGTTFTNILSRKKKMSTFSANVSGTVLAGTPIGNVFVSRDFGDTWITTTPITSGATTTLIASNGDLLCGTNGLGILRSTDGGGSWRAINAGINNASVLSLATDAHGALLAGVAGGVYRSTDRGITWSGGSTDTVVHPYWITNRVMSVLYLMAPSDSIIVAGTGEGQIVRSVDNGVTWSAVQSVYGGETIDATGAARALNGDLYIAYQLDGILRSTDIGLTWNRLPDTAAATLYDSEAFTVDGMNSIYTIGLFQLLYRSDDGGISWTLLPRPDSTDRYRYVSADPGGRLHIAAVSGKLFGSDDRGNTWRFENQFPGPVENMSYVRGETFAIADSVIYRSPDQGDTWQRYDAGLESLKVSSVTISPDGFAYAGTAGSGVYRSAQRVMDVREKPERNRAELRDVSTVSVTPRYMIVDLPNGSWKIDLINVLGITVGGCNNASGHIEIDISSLPSGRYFLRMVNGRILMRNSVLIVR
jgi:photosystem II stability/assembly factor-like uncharacterized protein